MLGDDAIHCLCTMARRGDRVADIGLAVGCDGRTVYNWIKRCGITYRPRRHGNAVDAAVEDDIVRRYEDGEGPTAIGRRHGLTACGVHGILGRREVEKHHDRRIYRYNDAFFDELGPKAVYWMAFLLADGYLNAERGFFAVQLSSRDRDQLERFREDIGSNHPIHDYDYGSGVSVIRIYSKQWWEALCSHGIATNTGLRREWPEGLPPRFWPDFFRGLTDGDGCWTKSGKQWVYSLVGNPKLIEGAAVTLYAELGLAEVKIPRAGRSKKAVHLRFSGNRSCFRIARYLYYGNGTERHLSRRFALIEGLLSNGPPSGRIRKRILSPDEEAMVVQLWTVEGEPQTALGESFGVSRTTIHNTLHRFGVLPGDAKGEEVDTPVLRENSSAEA